LLKKKRNKKVTKLGDKTLFKKWYSIPQTPLGIPLILLYLYTGLFIKKLFTHYLNLNIRKQKPIVFSPGAILLLWHKNIISYNGTRQTCANESDIFIQKLNLLPCDVTIVFIHETVLSKHTLMIFFAIRHLKILPSVMFQL